MRSFCRLLTAFLFAAVLAIPAAFAAAFQFLDEIYEGETISSAIVDCVSIDGADIFPGNVLNGATIIDGTNVLQFFQVGVSGWSWSCRPSYQFSGRADEVLQVLFLLNSWS